MRHKAISSYKISEIGNLDELRDIGGLEHVGCSRIDYVARSRTQPTREIRPLVADTESIFTKKREEWQNFISERASFEDYAELNRQLAKFPGEVSRDPEARQLLNKLDGLIQKIDEGIFSWREQYRWVKRLSQVFNLVRPFKTSIHFLFVDFTEVRDEVFPFSRFDPFFRTPHYSDDTDHFFATAISQFYTSLFWAFLRLYVTFPTGTYARIDDEMLSLIDPFTREKIRRVNRQRFQAEVEEPLLDQRSLMRLINQFMETFLITEPLRWGREQDSNVVVPILFLINEVLSLGLVEAEECQQLMLNIQLLTEALTFIEQSISPGKLDKTKLKALFLQDEYTNANAPANVPDPIPEPPLPKSTFHSPLGHPDSLQPGRTVPDASMPSVDNHEDLQKCKVLISKIVLQTIFVYSDRSFVSACQRNQHGFARNLEKDAIKGRLQTNLPLYKSICLILLRYLLAKHDLKCDPKLESQLEINQCMLLFFLTDSKSNYFMESVDLVHEEHARCYLEDPPAELAQQVNGIMAIKAKLLNLIRNPGPYQIRTQVLDILSDLCQSVPELEKAADPKSNVEVDPTELTAFRTRQDFEKVNLPLTLELAWRGLTRFVLLLAEVIKFKREEGLFLDSIFDLLKRLLKNNHVAQSILFRGGTCAAYVKIFRTHRFRSMRLLIDIFEHDFLLLTQSYQVFDIKMMYYTELLDTYEKSRLNFESKGSMSPSKSRRGIANAEEEGSRRLRTDIAALLLFNIFLDKVMKMNLKASKDKWRKYDLALQLKILDIVSMEALPMLLDPDYLTEMEQRHVDLECLGRFRFTKQKSKELQNIIDTVPLKVAYYYLSFSFLKLFVLSTTFVYPRVVYDRVTKVINNLSKIKFPEGFKSAIMLRTQFVKLVERFWIFPNNHLLYEGLRENEYIEFKRPLIPTNLKDICRFIEKELRWFDGAEFDVNDPNDSQIMMFRDYLYWAMLPALYKITRGVLSTISIMESASTVSNLWYFIDRIVQMMKFKDRTDKMWQVLNLTPPDPISDSRKSIAGLQSLIKKRGSSKMLSGIFPSGDQEELMENKPQSLNDLGDRGVADTEPNEMPDLDALSKLNLPLPTPGRRSRSRSEVVARGLQMRKRKSLYAVGEVLSKPKLDSKIGNEVFEELLNEDLGRCRKLAHELSEIVIRFYKQPMFEGQLPDQPLEPYHNTDRKWMFAHIKPQKVLRTSKDKRKEFEAMLKEARTQNHSIIWIVKQIYMRNEISHHGDKNPLIRLLTTDTHFQKYNYNVARSCISMLANMTPGDDSETSYRCFFVKQIYPDEMRAVNYLMNNSSELRKQMYIILKESTGTSVGKPIHLINFEGQTIAGAFLRGLWAIYVNLTLFIYYKTFDDKYLKYHWDLNLLVSEFIKNFFMDNFNKFKTFLSENPFGVTEPGSHPFSEEQAPVPMETIMSPERLSNAVSPNFRSANESENKESVSASDEDPDTPLDPPKEDRMTKLVTIRVNEPESEIGADYSGFGADTPPSSKPSNQLHESNLRDTSKSKLGLQLAHQNSKSFQSQNKGRLPRITNQRIRKSPFIRPKLLPIAGIDDHPNVLDARRQQSLQVYPADNVDEGHPESIFMENFVLMAQLFGNCSVARDLETCIVPGDRANVFAVLVQVLGNLTEFLTGPCLINQLRIHQHETYIWIGILNRYIEDVDDDFYHVKLAILEYLNGLTQGLNHRIIDFLAQQLQANMLYDVTITLGRLLFERFAVKQRTTSTIAEAAINDKHRAMTERAYRYSRYSKVDHFNTIESHSRNAVDIRSPRQLMDLYKTNTDFSSHLIMQIIVHSYVFMRSVGDKIKFWHIYLHEKENQARDWEERPQDKEANIIFMFILQMMFSIEVVYEINEDAGLDDGGDGSDIDDDDDHVPPEMRPVGTRSERSKGSKRGNRTFQSSRRRRGETSTGRDSERMASEAFNKIHMNSQNAPTSTAHKRIQRRFYFQTPPVSLYWTPAMKDKVMDNLPVRSTNRKQVYLYSMIKELTIEAETHYERYRQWGFLAYLVTPDAFNFYEVFLFFFSLAQNILLMVYMDSKPEEDAFSLNIENYEVLQIGWALALTGLSFIVLVLWMGFRWRIYMTLNERDKIALLRRPLTRTEKLRVWVLDSLIFNSTFSSFMLNFIITILGFTVYTGIYTLNLFLAVKIFKPMTDVLRAILHSGRQLLSTFQLMTLLIYFYAWVTILGLTDRIINDYQGPQNCRDLYTCLFNTWNFGLRESGGLGAALNALQEPSHNRFWLNWVVSISHLVIIKFIVLNIVAGIIIEGFGELRDERNKREFDVLNFCPICGMDRWESERVGMPFDTHRREVHNVWNYLKFLVRLNQMDSRNLVGFEFDISNQLHYNQTKWFPKNKVLSEEIGYEELDGDPEDDDDEDEDDDDD
jgi:hypothetical protein